MQLAQFEAYDNVEMEIPDTAVGDLGQPKEIPHSSRCNSDEEPR